MNGIAGPALRRETTSGVRDMHRNGERVVQRIQRRLRDGRSMTESEASLGHDVAKLEDRAERLRRLGSRYAHVQVSSDVRNLRSGPVNAQSAGR